MENGEEVDVIQEFYNNDNAPTIHTTCNYENTDTAATDEMTQINVREEYYSNFPDRYIQDFLQTEAMDLYSAQDNLEATKAVFQQLDIMVREQVETEIDIFKTNISKILTDQQIQFKQAFGLQEEIITTEAMHVVPQSGQEEELLSEDSRNACDQTESNDSDELVDRIQWYERLVECNQDDQAILKCLVRILTADAAVTAALRRKEYAT